jgi:thiamine monophosphate synthase
VRSARRWLREESRAVDELARLVELGVTWLEFTVRDASAAELDQQLERFDRLAREAGAR